MKKESLNYTFQLFLFPGICVLGLIISLIIKKINIMPVFYGLSACLRAFFSFCREIYGKGHWYSKKERILDGIVFIIIGMIGVTERKKTKHGAFSRLSVNSVEKMIREIGVKTEIEHVHPHRFRRTMATRAIDKGMPIEQVQVLLGHTKIDTTLRYANVQQANVQHSHQKFVC